MARRQRPEPPRKWRLRALHEWSARVLPHSPGRHAASRKRPRTGHGLGRRRERGFLPPEGGAPVRSPPTSSELPPKHSRKSALLSERRLDPESSWFYSAISPEISPQGRFY